MPRSSSFLVSCRSISVTTVLAARRHRREPLADHLIGLRIELAERQVLQLLAHLVHAHAPGKRRIDVDRLLRGAPPRLRRHEVERAHVVQPVGKLDQQHAHVGRDREQQLAQVFRLLRLARDEVELLQLGEAVDQRADCRPELLVDLGAGRCRVLDRVVQQRRHDRRVIELEVGQDRGDFERMGEIRIARGARLRPVRHHGVHIGAVEQVLVGVRIVGLDPVDQVVLPHHLRPALLRLLDLGRHDRRRSLHPPRGRLVLHARQIGLAGHTFPREPRRSRSVSVRISREFAPAATRLPDG